MTGDQWMAVACAAAAVTCYLFSRLWGWWEERDQRSTRDEWEAIGRRIEENGAIVGRTMAIAAMGRQVPPAPLPLARCQFCGRRDVPDAAGACKGCGARS